MKERHDKFAEHDVDLGEKGISPDMSTPDFEDGVSSLKDADVDVIVGKRQRGDELLEEDASRKDAGGRVEKTYVDEVSPFFWKV